MWCETALIFVLHAAQNQMCRRKRLLQHWCRLLQAMKQEMGHHRNEEKDKTTFKFVLAHLWHLVATVPSRRELSVAPSSYSYLRPERYYRIPLRRFH